MRRPTLTCREGSSWTFSAASAAASSQSLGFAISGYKLDTYCDVMICIEDGYGNNGWAC